MNAERSHLALLCAAAFMLLMPACRQPTTEDLRARPWMDSLEHFRPENRSEAIRKLAEMKYRQSAHRIAKRINDIRPDVRLDAIRALGELGDPASVSALHVALSEPEWVHRKAAVVSLGRIGHESAIPIMIGALADRDQAVGRAAAEALAAFGPKAEDPLLQSLASGPMHARPNAAIALGIMKSEKAHQSLRDALAVSNTSLRVSAMFALASFADAQDVRTLAGLMGDTDLSVSRAAADAVSRIGPAAVNAMAPATTNRNRHVRMNAYRVLVAHRTEPGAVEALLAGWDDHEEGISRTVRDAFSSHGQPRTNVIHGMKPQLLAALRSPSDQVRQRALELLEPAIDSEDAGAVIALLADRNDSVKRTAIGVLAGIRDDRARAELAKLADSGPEETRFLAMFAMAGHGNDGSVTGTIAYIESLTGPRTDQTQKGVPAFADNRTAARVDAAVTALGRSRDKRAIPVLARMVPVSGEALFASVCRALANMEAPEAFDALVTASQDRHWYWGAGRNAALRGLAKSDPKRAAEYFVDILTTTNYVFEDARDISISELGSLGSPRSAACIAPHLVHDREETRNVAGLTLVAMKGAAVEGLIASAATTNRTLRAAIAFTLAEIGTPALPALKNSVLSTTPEIRETAAWAIGQTKEPGESVQSLADRLNSDEAQTVRAACAWAIGQIKVADEAVITGLAKMLRKDSSASCRQTAGFALGEIAPTSAVPALVEALTDSENAVRAVAAGALGRIATPAVVPHLQKVARDDLVLEVRLAANNALIAMGQTGDSVPGKRD